MTKRYDVILADVAWWYNRRGSKDSRFGLGSWQYDLMRDDEVVAMGDWVREIAKDNSVLFMWVTAPKLPMGLLALTAWGYRYATVAFSWVKINRRKGNLKSGPGHYTASNMELCLLGVRGSLMPTGVQGSANKQIILEVGDHTEALLLSEDEDQPDIVVAPSREHSQKPDIVRVRIEQMYPDADRIELFCRFPADGWDVWGRGVGEDQPLAEPRPLPDDDQYGYSVDLARALGVKGNEPRVRPLDSAQAPEPPWAGD